MKKLKHFSLGFVFDLNHGHLLLIQKQRPEYLVGLWNGIGGLVEPGESPVGSMVREAREEVGLNTTASDWLNFHYERHEGYALHCYAMHYINLKGAFKTLTDEKAQVFKITHHFTGMYTGLNVHDQAMITPPMVSNLWYMLPMAVIQMQHPNSRPLEG